jgi:hypothetical protein
VKLRIFDSYPVSVSSPRDLVGRRLMVKSEVGGALLPVWPIVNATDTLSNFYNWIENLAPGKDSGLWSSDVTKRIQAAKSFQASLITNGFCFVIIEGDTVKWCGKNRKVLIAFMQELAGFKIYNPPSLSILSDKFNPDNPEDSEIKNLALMTPTGVVQKTLSVVSIFASLFKRQEDGGSAFSKYINGIDYPTIENFYKGEVKPRSASDWDDVESDKILAAFAPSETINEFKSNYPNDDLMASTTAALAVLKKRSLIRSLGWSAELLKRASNDSPELAKLILAATGQAAQTESLIESSFRELLRSTVDNGGYKIGGLRRVGRIWVYDRSIPGRASNSRFVVTRRPVLQLDTDGFPVYKFQFRSRPDRNTTNMSHQGYIKFVEKPKFLARVRNFFRDEIDLQVHVHCTCPDFKYRWHWILAKNNCSHQPTGIGFDATDQPPDKTNPRGLISMCKHLVVAKDYVLLSANEHQKIVKNLQKASPLKSGDLNKPDSREVKPGAEVVDAD